FHALTIGAAGALLVILRPQQLLLTTLALSVLAYQRYQASRSTRTTVVTIAIASLPVIAALAEVLVSNYWMTGSPWRTPYHFGDEQFQSIDLHAPLVGAVLFHPWHGFFIYHPFYALGVAVLAWEIVRAPSMSERAMYVGVALVIAAFVYLQASWCC